MGLPIRKCLCELIRKLNVTLSKNRMTASPNRNENSPNFESGRRTFLLAAIFIIIISAGNIFEWLTFCQGKLELIFVQLDINCFEKSFHIFG
ncbi:hypothetical protein CEXT_706261 [Caerostris extrusa]|uniref:Uncharacterized protein n=1 Tax=Caerostris extrusa TaxID=172846 RepID=A0AAV4MLY9_CAEEX|nr:hypothetical protein CEXT_706261 [Caerostris extrusa]